MTVAADDIPDSYNDHPCNRCLGRKTVPAWNGCGCGRGVKHFADCGTRPPEITCPECNGIAPKLESEI